MSTASAEPADASARGVCVQLGAEQTEMRREGKKIGHDRRGRQCRETERHRNKRRKKQTA